MKDNVRKPYLLTWHNGYERYESAAALKAELKANGISEKYGDFNWANYDNQNQQISMSGPGAGRLRNITCSYQPKIISVTVFYDTIKPDYDELKDGENLIDVELPEALLIDWYFKNLDDGCHECMTDEEVFNQWYMNYTADDTCDLYDDLKQFISLPKGVA